MVPEKRNAGVAARDQRDKELTAAEARTLENSARKLQEKAALYERMQREPAPDDHGEVHTRTQHCPF